MSRRRMVSKRHSLMIRWGFPCVAGTALLIWISVAMSERSDPSARNADGSITGLTSRLEREISPDMVRFRFEEVAAARGLEFTHFPATRNSLLPEDMGPGMAWGDIDGDGDPDLFLCNMKGDLLGASGAGRCALFRNDDGRFVDVSAASGADLLLFAQGCGFFDFDNDDDLDLYVTAYGANVLLENDGAGAFEDVTERAGVADESFGAGCAFGDYDEDGYVDLYVCNYVEFQFNAADRERSGRQYGSEIPYTINPSSYPPVQNRLYRNNGDGTFTDVAEEAGVANAQGRSLGALFFDFELDGDLDLYVANDVSENGVYRNRGDGTFEDIGASSLAADYRGAMGMAVTDLDRDGDLDLFVTHWIAQENAFFENMHSAGMTDDDGRPMMFFMDRAEELGLGQVSLKTVGWATGFVDFDNDGFLDLWVTNGNTLEEADRRSQLKPQLTHLFWHKPGGEGFFEIGAAACEALATPIVGRGGAAADFDGDGRVDIALLVHGGRPLLLHNVTRAADQPAHWLRLELRQRGGNSRALGALVTVTCGADVQRFQVGADGSYLSGHPTTLHIGLGRHQRATQVEIRWPDRSVEVLRDLEADRTHLIQHDAVYEDRSHR